MHLFKNYLVIIFINCLFLIPVSAYSLGFQIDKKILDTSYVADYHNELIIRTFGSRKYTIFSLQDKGYAEKLKYLPNSPFNVGLGFNYKMIGINLGFNLPIINETSKYGKTNFIDLQSHAYGRKLIVDFYLQRYKGYYLADNVVINFNNYDKVYIRPDLATLNFGVEIQYLLNWNKFTFRGAFLQNEIQLKSAGSPIIGAFVGLVNIKADSSVIPKDLKYIDYFNNYNFYKSSIRTSNFSIGYGYTLVLPYHFFLTAAASAGLGFNTTLLQQRGMGSTAHLGSSVAGTLRLGLGYNSRRFFSGIHFVGTRYSHNTPIQYARQEFAAGNFRMSFAYRFTLKKKLFKFY